jgi:hypothetical protein
VDVPARCVVDGVPAAGDAGGRVVARDRRPQPDELCLARPKPKNKIATAPAMTSATPQEERASSGSASELDVPSGGPMMPFRRFDLLAELLADDVEDSAESELAEDRVEPSFVVRPSTLAIDSFSRAMVARTPRPKMRKAPNPTSASAPTRMMYSIIPAPRACHRKRRRTDRVNPRFALAGRKPREVGTSLNTTGTP